MSRVKSLKKELGDYAAIDTIAKMDGGLAVAKSLRQDVLNSVDRLANNYQELSHAELMGLCATLRANLGVIRVFKNAGTNKKILEEELDLALKEEGQEAES